MKYFTTTGAVLLSALTATAGGIKLDPEDEGEHIRSNYDYKANLRKRPSAASLDSMHTGSCQCTRVTPQTLPLKVSESGPSPTTGGRAALRGVA
jgi:hypothetical protein